MLNKIKHYETYEWKERASLKYSETYSKQTMKTGYRMGIFIAKFTLIKVPQIWCQNPNTSSILHFTGAPSIYHIQNWIVPCICLWSLFVSVWVYFKFAILPVLVEN